jgi:hypothetical protein
MRLAGIPNWVDYISLFLMLQRVGKNRLRSNPLYQVALVEDCPPPNYNSIVFSLQLIGPYMTFFNGAFPLCKVNKGCLTRIRRPDFRIVSYDMDDTFMTDNKLVKQTIGTNLPYCHVYFMNCQRQKDLPGNEETYSGPNGTFSFIWVLNDHVCSPLVYINASVSPIFHRADTREEKICYTRIYVRNTNLTTRDMKALCHWHDLSGGSNPTCQMRRKDCSSFKRIRKMVPDKLGWHHSNKYSSRGNWLRLAKQRFEFRIHYDPVEKWFYDPDFVKIITVT